MQVAATLGFVLGRRNGQFLKGLRPKEIDAIREILVWGRQSLNNKILQFNEHGVLPELVVRQYKRTAQKPQEAKAITLDSISKSMAKEKKKV